MQYKQAERHARVIVLSILKINKVKVSRLAQVDLENIPFGRVFTDHMLVSSYKDGAWGDTNIQPYGPIEVNPAITGLHYGQNIFEGLKAYKTAEGRVLIFRPEANFRRINHSASRMAMPALDQDTFLGGIKELVALDADWIPPGEDASLYIRPFMFATDAYVGIKVAENYKFITICCPVHSYYSQPVKVKIEKQYARAMPGGTGSAKCAGNYGASLYPASVASKEGYNQILWTDAIEHKYIEESGTMNVMFVINGAAVTPPISGTILDGITRDSVIKLLDEMGYQVEVRPVTVEEVTNAAENGKLQEAFGMGTAATIAKISTIGTDSKVYDIPLPEDGISSQVFKRLEDIRRGKAEDIYSWTVEV